MAELTAATKALLREASTATLATQLFKRGLRNTFIQGVGRLTANAPVMVGEAFTLRMIPAREDLDHPGMFTGRSHPQRRAIEECPAGSVLVIDCRKETGAGCLGDILIARLMERRRRRASARTMRSTSRCRSPAATSRCFRATCWWVMPRGWW